MRLGPPPAEPEVPGQFWIDFIRDTAPVFRKSHARADRRVHPAHVAGADRRREVRQPAARGDHRRARARRRRRGQRRARSPRSWRPARPWVRIVSCNPAEIGTSGRPVLVGLCGRRPGAVARVPRGVRASPRRHVGTSSTPSAATTARAALRTAPGSGLHARVPVPQPLRLPGRGRLPACHRRSARRGTGWTRRSGQRTGPGSCREHLAERPGALIYLSLGSLGSADVELMQRLVDLLGRTRPPRDRVQGAAGRPDPTPRQHDRRVVPAPAGRAAAGRPGADTRRQQHRRRVLPQRQADGRAAAVLGPGRQRAARGRDGVRAATARPTASATRSCCGRSTGCWRTSHCGSGWARSPPGCRPRPGRSVPLT